MNLQPLMRKTRNRARRLYSFLPAPTVARPVFVLGCGRSGKSTLIEQLARVAPITYLHEPRDLWISVFPQADIWTPMAAARGGRLVLDARDHDPARARRLSRLFRLQALHGGRPVVVEELAINSFRLALIKRIFPDARFIHVYRNGLEVAELIAEKAATVGWFGRQGYKWAQIVQHAQSHPQTRHLPALCDDFKKMGLLEWRLSTQAIVSFFADMRNDCRLELNSRTMLDNPEGTLARVCRFLAIDARAAPAPRPRTRTRAQAIIEPTTTEKRIGGPLLPLSVQTDDDLTGHFLAGSPRGATPSAEAG